MEGVLNCPVGCIEFQTTTRSFKHMTYDGLLCYFKHSNIHREDNACEFGVQTGSPKSFSYSSFSYAHVLDGTLELCIIKILDTHDALRMEHMLLYELPRKMVNGLALYCNPHQLDKKQVSPPSVL